MERGVIVRGRLRGLRIDLDEPIDDIEGDVEVFVRPAHDRTPPPPDVLDVLTALPPGASSKEEIDRRLAEERASWVDRG